MLKKKKWVNQVLISYSIKMMVTYWFKMILKYFEIAAAASV